MDYRVLETAQKQKLLAALRHNAQTGEPLYMDRETSFTTEPEKDQLVVSAIRSIPCHY